MNKAMAGKKKVRVRDEAKYEYAWLLFSQQVRQQDIAAKVGVSPRTLTRWAHDDNWVSKRAVSSVTRDELVNKTLNLIDTLLSKSIEDGGGNSAKFADQLSKLAGTIRNLDKQASVVDIVQVFMTFNKWLINQQHLNPDLTDETIKIINRYQDMFLGERLSIHRP